MSDHDSVVVESTRRRLNQKQADVVERLTRAAADVLGREGFDGLTVRMVASAAGVSTATAYTYFSSKEHLVAEMFWRRLVRSDQPEYAREQGAAERVVAALRQVTAVLGSDPEIAKAITSALLGSAPDVAHLRLRIGLEIRDRIVGALGADADPDAVAAVEMLYSGALLRAGMGYTSYAATNDPIEKSTHLLLR